MVGKTTISGAVVAFAEIDQDVVCVHKRDGARKS